MFSKRGNMPSFQEEIKRQQELAELDALEAERQDRQMYGKGTSRTINKKGMYYFRWIVSGLFLAATTELLVEDHEIGPAVVGLIFTVLINPFAFEWLRGCFGKVFRH